MVANISDSDGSTPAWRIVKCGPEDKESIYQLMNRSFFKDDPLGCEGMENPSMDDMFALKRLDQGHSFMAVLPTGQIVGIAINVNFADLPDNESHNDPPLSGRLLEIAKYFEFVDSISGLDESGLIEMFFLDVDPLFRRQGMAKELGRESLAYAESQGFRGLKIFCTSKYSADMALSLGFKLVYSLAYEDYKDDDGKPIFTPPPPHTHTRILIKEFKSSV